MNSKLVLIIDDEEFIRDLLSDFLGMEGFACRCAATADAALTQIHETDRPFDLIILDRNLENSLAEDLITKIRALNLTPPILLLTGDHEIGQREAQKMGATGVVHKPFQIDHLLAILQQILENS